MGGPLPEALVFTAAHVAGKMRNVRDVAVISLHRWPAACLMLLASTSVSLAAFAATATAQAPPTSGTVAPAAARPPDGPADQAAPRADQNSMKAHAQLLEKAKQGRIDIYFEGDSIVRRWGAIDYPELLANWKANFHGWNAADFGWGADRTQNILWRLQHGELDGIHPRVIVLLAGTNNVGAEPGDQAKVADITRGVKAIVDLCREKAPEATIILTAIFPRNDNLAVMPTIFRINARLGNIADGRKVRFLNINDRLADADGRLVEGVLNARDQLHPTLKGYQIWADALKPIVRELLGPAAAIDLAPPPTGDPGATQRQTIQGAARPPGTSPELQAKQGVWRAGSSRPLRARTMQRRRMPR
jgi:lysophospholipase L1-like esterase